MLQTIIKWSLKQPGWRAQLIQFALLTGLWLVIAMVFATEFYFSANGMGIGITWWDAARTAFRDWVPWMLISPAVVFLARRFRLHRDRWRRHLVIHLAACSSLTVFYAGLLAVTDPFAPSGGIAFSGPGVTNGSDKPDNGANGAGYGIKLYAHAGKWTRLLSMGMVKAQFAIPVYWCIVCVCWMIIHFREASKRESRTLELETLLMQSNLQALKMQLQPHFLFNTLNAISSLIHENPRMADDMIGSLSQFLRATLESSSENEIPLSKELDFIDCYLEIQQTRFGERLQIRREISDTVLGALVPPLILQPLVENAVRHGVEPMEAGGTVTIRAWRNEDTLHLSISDTGPGFTGNKGPAGGSGIGLSNTRARLSNLYGGQHEFRLSDSPPTGARVTIQIPFRDRTAAERA